MFWVILMTLVFRKLFPDVISNGLKHFLGIKRKRGKSLKWFHDISTGTWTASSLSTCVFGSNDSLQQPFSFLTSSVFNVHVSFYQRLPESAYIDNVVTLMGVFCIYAVGYRVDCGDVTKLWLFAILPSHAVPLIFYLFFIIFTYFTLFLLSTSCLFCSLLIHFS